MVPLWFHHGWKPPTSWSIHGAAAGAATAPPVGLSTESSAAGRPPARLNRARQQLMFRPWFSGFSKMHRLFKYQQLIS